MPLIVEMWWVGLCWCCRLLGYYYVFAFLASVSSALANIDWGVEAAYLASLDAVFHWAVQFCRVHEEDEPESAHSLKADPGVQHSASASSSVGFSTPQFPRRGLIQREAAEILRLTEQRGDVSPKESVFLGLTEDLLDYSKAAVEAIVDDELTSSFSVEELPYWNLLARNKGLYTHFNWRLNLIWALGFLFRYLLLAPVRIALLVFGLGFLSTGCWALGFVEERRRGPIGAWLTIASFRFLSRTLSLSAHFHGKENAKRDGGGICVANHTSPIDAVVLNTEITYCLTGQQHGGWLGFACSSLSKVVPHLWFNRDDSKDRAYVGRKLREHAHNPDHPPTLIFPEGVCVNNTAVVMFKKGAFEATERIWPIAMRYNAKYGDAFWGLGGWSEYILAMLTSWAIVVDVHYMPPMDKLDGEAAADFADRTKAAIATQVGIRFLKWDGRLHLYTVVKPEMLAEQRAKAATRIRNLSGGGERLVPSLQFTETGTLLDVPSVSSASESTKSRDGSTQDDFDFTVPANGLGKDSNPLVSQSQIES